jgi:glutamate-ammonia-ligase adenylyltransferase
MTESLPAALVDRLHSDWDAFQHALEQASLSYSPRPDFKKVLMQVWAGSRFVSHLCIDHPEVFLQLLQAGELHRDYRPGEYRLSLQHALNKDKDEDALMLTLRNFRQREMFRIAWRDLAGWAPLSETLRDLSLLADACVDLSLAKLHQWACKQWGVPRQSDGRPQQLVVLGMGKLGAYELNFSSDIDLIFAYPEDGQTRKRNGISCEEFFTRVGRQLIHVIDSSTDRGFVFRVDMRLRPYGDSGALAVSFAAMEEYYQYQGREWERYAMIKARVIAGDFVAGNALLAELRPFTYRRYLDYSAFESLREMKDMIARQVQRKGMEENIKLGLGGIREIEFIGQAFQLIRGGREPELQIRGIVPVLKYLAEKDYLPDYVTQQLLQAYTFLRNTENHMQAYAEQQIHVLPTDDEERASLVVSMGFSDWDSFYVKLQRHRQNVHSAFEQIMAAPQVSAKSEDPDQLSAVWQGLLDDDGAVVLLQQQGYEDVDYVLDLIKSLRSSYAYSSRSTIGQQRMDRLMPLLLGAAGHARQPDQCLLRLITLLEAISGRSTYLALLAETPMALSHVVQLFAQSEWIAEHLTQHPVLLDEFLDPRSLYAPLRKQDLRRDLENLLAHLEDDDLEQQMEALRYFKQSNVLHVAAADLVNAISLINVSNHLTDIAEVILEQVLKIAMRTLLNKYGAPVCMHGTQKKTAGFIVIGYGKLGGIELGYGSDLDLVFLHNSAGKKQQTEGEKKLDNAVFFARLGQRFIHILNTLTASGVLYEVDMRLRPSGASGLLVTSLDAFRQYQQEEAWTWEHQALVRARPIVGDAELIESFGQLRREIICQPRDPQQLRKDVVEMRERMRTELGSKKKDRFHLKQDEGGMADIEFLVQYLVLRWAHSYPDLVDYSDNLRQLEGLKQHGVLKPAEADDLFEAYRTYRAQGHRQTLIEEPSYVAADCFVESRQRVRELWRQFMLEPL